MKIKGCTCGSHFGGGDSHMPWCRRGEPDDDSADRKKEEEASKRVTATERFLRTMSQRAENLASPAAQGERPGGGEAHVSTIGPTRAQIGGAQGNTKPRG